MRITSPIYVKYFCNTKPITRQLFLLAICIVCFSSLGFGQRTADRSTILSKGDIAGQDTVRVVSTTTAPTFFESFEGNPTCADIAARYPSDNVVEPNGLKLNFNGVYSDTFLFDTYTSPYGNVILFPPGSVPTNPAQMIMVTTSGVNSISSFLSQKPITAVMIKAGNLANVWYYNIPGVGHTFDGGNLTAINPQGTSHLLFCYEQPLTPSAAGVTVSGRAVNPEGRGITNARITLTDQAGQSRTVVTGRTGRYAFEDVESGNTYILSISSRRYSFDSPSLVITPIDNISDADFIATW